MPLITIRVERVARPSSPERASGHPRRRLVAASIAALLGVAGIVTCLAGAASGAGSTTNVAFIALTTPHKVLSATIQPNATTSAAVIGGSTTVPTNATTVQLTLTAKGTKSGLVTLYPAGNQAGGGFANLVYQPTLQASGTFAQNVGTSDDLTFKNVGTAAVVVTATVTGYSTQVTDGDISGADGTSGQVLTNTGSGAAWENTPASAALPTVYTDRTTIVTLTTTPTAAATLTLPAGTYLFTATGTVDYNGAGSDTDAGSCGIKDTDISINPFALSWFGVNSTIVRTAIAAQWVMTIPAGTVTNTCVDANDDGLVSGGTLTATPVNQITQ